MCGLAGIFAYAENAAPVDQAELLRVRDYMLPRGPDGAGLWISPDARIGLAHRRLSIIDLSNGGAQPMLDPITQNQIVFNGEIYNYRELRHELEDAGHVFYSTSDTEVLLKLYVHCGAKMLNKLRGMFAFAVWDAAKGGVFLARDQFGIKPLYFSDDGKTLRFASQVKALLAGGSVDTTPDPAGHVGFLLWGHLPEPYTMFKGIQAVPAGTYMWIDSRGRPDQVKYFSLGDVFLHASPLNGGRHIRDEEAKEVLAHALFDSVSHHMVADVPVGVFLSAGLDSTTLAAFACYSSATPLRTVTLGFNEFYGNINDEVPLSCKVSENLGTQHYTKIIKREDFANNYEGILAAMDQPSIDGLNTYFVSMAARDAGLKVVLSGLGGDEIFEGYNSFSYLPKIVRRTAPFAAIPGSGKLLRKLSAPIASRIGLPKLAGIAEYGGDLISAYLMKRGLYMPWEVERLLGESTMREGIEKLQIIQELAKTTADIPAVNSRISALEMNWYMKNQLLRDSDWASMAHSLELRVPFIDVPFLRTIASLKCSGWKPSKREMALASPLKPLDMVLNRQKSGFSVPIRSWVTGQPQNGKVVRLDSRIYSTHLISHLRKEGVWKLDLKHAKGFSDRVGLLCTEILVHGGVQSFMSRLVEVLDGRVKSGQLSNAALFSLNDKTEPLKKHFQIGSQWLVKGGKKTKWYFIWQLLFTNTRFKSLLVGHLNLGPLALAMRWMGRIEKYHVILHGIEAWQRLGWLNRLGLKCADSVIATTDYTAEVCARTNSLDKSRFSIIPLCADDKHITPDPAFALRGEVKLLCVARQDRTERYKGIENIVDALKQLVVLHPDLHLNLVGSGNDQLRLKTYVSDNRLDANVTFWGSVSDNVLAKAYDSCDIYVMPSCKEGFGISFLEAMARSKPCIGGRHGGTPEVIDDGRSGYLVDYGNVADLVGRLDALCKDPQLRLVMGQRGRELVNNKFSFEAFSRAYDSLIE